MKNWLKKGSIWASGNRKKAIAVIVLIQILCGTIAALAGIWLFADGQIFPEWSAFPILFSLSLAVFTFPKKRFLFESRLEKSRRWSLERAHHGVFFSLTMVAMIVFGNRLYVNTFEEKGPIIGTTLSIFGSSENAEKMPFSIEKTTKKGFLLQKLTTPNRKFSQKMIEKMREKTADGHPGRAFFTGFLVCLLGGFLMMILGCNISCGSGSAIGGVLLLVGVLSIIASFVLLILGILAAAGTSQNRTPRPPREPRPKGWNLPDAVKD